MPTRKELKPQIVHEWLSRQPSGQRREIDVLTFYSWVKKNRRDLLSFRASGDKYQILKSILRQHIES